MRSVLLLLITSVSSTTHTEPVSVQCFLRQLTTARIRPLYAAAAAHLLLTTGPPAVQQSINISCCWAHSSIPTTAVARWDRHIQTH